MNSPADSGSERPTLGLTAFKRLFKPSIAQPKVDIAGRHSHQGYHPLTDANAMLRILFSRLGQPHIGSPNAFSFNVPSVRASGAVTVERGTSKTVRATFTRTGGMCPRCEGRGSVTDFDLSQLYDDSKSLNEGALTIPGYS